MPYVNVQLLEGVSREQKAALVADITQSLVARLGKNPDHIHIVIQEIAPSSWGYQGRLTDTLQTDTQSAAD